MYGDRHQEQSWWSPRHLRPLACTSVRGVGGWWMRAQPARAKHWHHWFILTLVWGEEEAEAAAFSRAQTCSIFSTVEMAAIFLHRWVIALCWNFLLSVEDNTSLFTKVLLLIHWQSGMHLFNIQSNTLQLAWPWASACLPACLFVCFLSSMSRRQTWMYSRGRDGALLCTLEETVTFLQIGFCVIAIHAPSSWASTKLALQREGGTRFVVVKVQLPSRQLPNMYKEAAWPRNNLSYDKKIVLDLNEMQEINIGLLAFTCGGVVLPLVQQICLWSHFSEEGLLHFVC